MGGITGGILGGLGDAALHLMSRPKGEEAGEKEKEKEAGIIRAEREVPDLEMEGKYAEFRHKLYLAEKEACLKQQQQETNERGQKESSLV